MNASDNTHVHKSMLDAAKAETAAIQARLEALIRFIDQGYHVRSTGWRKYAEEELESAIEAAKGSGNQPRTFKRDPDAECEHYEKALPDGQMTTWDECETDGHYLCNYCIHKSREAAKGGK